MWIVSSVIGFIFILSGSLGIYAKGMSVPNSALVAIGLLLLPMTINLIDNITGKRIEGKLKALIILILLFAIGSNI